MSCSRFPKFILLVAALAALPACSSESDPANEASKPAEKTSKRRQLNPNAKENQGKMVPDKAIERGAEIPAPKIAGSWSWEKLFDPELAPGLDWDLEERLSGVNWASEELLTVDGEAVTWDELEEWLYHTQGAWVSNGYFELLLVRELRSRWGLPAVEPLPREQTLKFADQLAVEAGVVPAEIDSYLTARFPTAEIARLGFALRLELFRLLIEGLPEGALPEEYANRFGDPRLPATTAAPSAMEMLDKLMKGENPSLYLSSLNKLASNVVPDERGMHLYTRFDHDDGLGGIATVIRKHEIGPNDSLKGPWTLGGEAYAVTLEELRREVPVDWQEWQKLHGLRRYLAFRIMRKELTRMGNWPEDDNVRWENYWSGINEPVATGMTYERFISMVWGLPSHFEVRVMKQMRDYEKIGRQDEILDPAKMAAFIEANRWNLDQWKFGGAVVMVPFVNSATALTAGADAERKALEKIQTYKERYEDTKDFELVAYQAAQDLPVLEGWANQRYREHYEAIQNGKGQISGNRGGLQLAFYEFMSDIWTRSNSLAEHFIQLKPGEVAGPWKGTTGWYLVRMYRGNATRPRAEAQDLGDLPPRTYLDYAFWQWSAAVLRKAEVVIST